MVVCPAWLLYDRCSWSANESLSRRKTQRELVVPGMESSLSIQHANGGAYHDQDRGIMKSPTLSTSGGEEYYNDERVRFEEATDVLLEVQPQHLQELWTQAVRVNASTDSLGTNSEASIQELELHMCLLASDGTRITEDVVLDYTNWRKNRKAEEPTYVALGLDREPPRRIWLYVSVTGAFSVLIAGAYPLLIQGNGTSLMHWSPQAGNSNPFLKSLCVTDATPSLTPTQEVRGNIAFSIVSQPNEEVIEESTTPNWDFCVSLVATFSGVAVVQSRQTKAKAPSTKNTQSVLLGCSLSQLSFNEYPKTDSYAYVAVNGLVQKFSDYVEKSHSLSRQVVSTFSLLGVVSRGDGSLTTSPFLLGTAVRDDGGHWRGDWLPSVPMELPEDAFTASGSDYHMLLYVVVPSPGAFEGKGIPIIIAFSYFSLARGDGGAVPDCDVMLNIFPGSPPFLPQHEDPAGGEPAAMFEPSVCTSQIGHDVMTDFGGLSLPANTKHISLEELDVLPDAAILPPHLEIIDTEEVNADTPTDVALAQRNGVFPLGISLKIQIVSSGAVHSLCVRKMLAAGGIGSLRDSNGMCSFLDELDSQYHRAIIQTYESGKTSVTPSVWMSEEFGNCPSCIQWIPPSILDALSLQDSSFSPTGMNSRSRLRREGVMLALLFSHYFNFGFSIFHPKCCSSADLVKRKKALEQLLAAVTATTAKSLVDVVEKRGFSHLLSHVSRVVFSHYENDVPDKTAEDKKNRNALAMIYAFSVSTHSQVTEEQESQQRELREIVSVLSQHEHDLFAALSCTLGDFYSQLVCLKLPTAEHYFPSCGRPSSTHKSLAAVEVAEGLLGSARPAETESRQVQLAFGERSFPQCMTSIALSLSQWYYGMTNSSCSVDDTIWAIRGCSRMCAVACIQACRKGSVCGFRIRAWCRHVASYANALYENGSFFEELEANSSFETFRKEFDLTGLEDLFGDDGEYAVDQRLFFVAQQQMWQDIGLAFGHLQLLLMRSIIRIILSASDPRLSCVAAEAAHQVIPVIGTLLPRQLAIGVSLALSSVLHNPESASNKLQEIMDQPRSTSDADTLSNGTCQVHKLFWSMINSDCVAYVSESADDKSEGESKQASLLIRVLGCRGVSNIGGQYQEVIDQFPDHYSDNSYTELLCGALAETTFSNNGIALEPQPGFSSKTLALLYDDETEAEEAREVNEKETPSTSSSVACQHAALRCTGILQAWCFPAILRTILQALQQFLTLPPENPGMGGLARASKLLFHLTAIVSSWEERCKIHVMALCRMIPLLFDTIEIVRRYKHSSTGASVLLGLESSLSGILVSAANTLDGRNFLLEKLLPRNLCYDAISTLSNRMGSSKQAEEELWRFQGDKRLSLNAYRFHAIFDEIASHCEYWEKLGDTDVRIRGVNIDAGKLHREMFGMATAGIVQQTQKVLSACIDWLRESLGEEVKDISLLHRMLAELLDSPRGSYSFNEPEMELIPSILSSSLWIAGHSQIPSGEHAIQNEHVVTALSLGKKCFDFALHRILLSLRQAYVDGSIGSDETGKLVWRSTVCEAARVCMSVVSCGAQRLKEENKISPAYLLYLPIDEELQHFDALPETWWINSPLHALLQLMRLEESFEMRNTNKASFRGSNSPSLARYLKCPDVTRTIVATVLDWIVSSLAPSKPTNACLYILDRWSEWWRHTRCDSGEGELEALAFKDFTILPLDEIKSLSDISDLECPVIPFCNVRDALVSTWPWATANTVLSLLYRLLSGTVSVESDLLVNDLESRRGLGWIFEQLSKSSVNFRGGLRLMPLPENTVDSGDGRTTSEIEREGEPLPLQMTIEAARSLEQIAAMVNAPSSLCILDLMGKLQGGSGVIDKDTVLKLYLGEQFERIISDRGADERASYSEASSDSEGEDGRVSVLWAGGLDDNVAIGSILAREVYHLISLNRQRNMDFFTGVTVNQDVTVAVTKEVFGKGCSSICCKGNSLLSPEPGAFYAPLQRIVWNGWMSADEFNLQFSEALKESSAVEPLSWRSVATMLFLLQFIEGVFIEALTACERSAEWKVALDLCDSLKKYYEWEGRQLMGVARLMDSSSYTSQKQAAELLKMKIDDLNDLRNCVWKASNGESSSTYFLPESFTTICRETARELNDHPELLSGLEDSEDPPRPRSLEFTPPLKLEPIFYSVYFQGSAFGEEERNRWFIYRLWETHTRETLISQLQEEYPFATVVSGDFPVTFLSFDPRLVESEDRSAESLGCDAVPVEFDREHDSEFLVFAGAGDGIASLVSREESDLSSLRLSAAESGDKNQHPRKNFFFRFSNGSESSVENSSAGDTARVLVFPASSKPESTTSKQRKKASGQQAVFESFVSREKTVKFTSSADKEPRGETDVHTIEHSLLKGGPVLAVGKFKQSREDNVDIRIEKKDGAPVVKVLSVIESGPSLWHQRLPAMLSSAANRQLLGRREHLLQHQSILVQWATVPDVGRLTPWITRRERVSSVIYESNPIVFGCLHRVQTVSDILVNRLRWIYGTTIVNEISSKGEVARDSEEIPDAYENELAAAKLYHNTSEDETNYGVFGINYGSPDHTSHSASLGVYAFEDDYERSRWFASKKNLSSLTPIVLGWRPHQARRGRLLSPLDLFGVHRANRSLPKDYMANASTASRASVPAQPADRPTKERTRRTTLLWPPRKETRISKAAPGEDGTSSSPIDAEKGLIRARGDTSRSILSESKSSVTGSPRHYGIYDPLATNRELRTLLRSQTSHSAESDDGYSADAAGSAFGQSVGKSSAITDLLRSKGMISKSSQRENRRGRTVTAPGMASPSRSGLGIRFLEESEVFHGSMQDPYGSLKGKATHDIVPSSDHKRRDAVPLPSLVPPSAAYGTLSNSDGSPVKPRTGTQASVEINLEEETGEILSASAAGCVLASAVIDGLNISSRAANDPQVARQLLFDYSMLKESFIASERTRMKREFHRKQKERREAGKSEQEPPDYDSMVPREWHWAAVRLQRSLQVLSYLVDKASQLHERLAQMENEKPPLLQAYGDNIDISEQQALLSVMRGQSTFRSLANHEEFQGSDGAYSMACFSIGALSKEQRKSIFDSCVSRLLYTSTL
eukprot:gb/GECG01000878.1/.p1 GENE.gb/GECG01000878.1/~~gb/GECG01000878.1/.p1  ORF type:complete len:3089 (+),score=375.51 gb/GECG01000878.1/:1-9267(+)